MTSTIHQRTKMNPGSAIGYRITSNDNAVTYYGHERCVYNHKTIGVKPLEPCRRYTTKIDAGPDDWMQCLSMGMPGMNNGDEYAGLNCWYGCRNPSKLSQRQGEAKKTTGVFSTSYFHGTGVPGTNSRVTLMDPDNKEGDSKWSQSPDFENVLLDDVLMWVR